MVVVVKGAAGQVDDPGIETGKAAGNQELVAAAGGHQAAGAVGHTTAQGQGAADGLDGPGVGNRVTNVAKALYGAGVGNGAPGQVGGKVGKLHQAAIAEAIDDVGGAGSHQQGAAVVREIAGNGTLAGDDAAGVVVQGAGPVDIRAI